MDLQHRLEPRLKTELRHLPLPLLLARLSLVTLPVAELQHTLESLLGDNPFFSLVPPNLPSRGPSVPTDDIEHAPDMDEELRLQLAACPALRGLDGAAAALPQCIDGDGRLTVAVDELAELLGLSPDDASLLLAAVRDWVEPPGLFARDLAECLLLQLRRRGEEAGDAATLLREAARDLERGGPSAAMKALGWSEERMDAAILRLRGLDPHPGRVFQRAETVVPELEFSAGPDGSIRTRLLTDRLPRVLLDADLFRHRGTPELAAQWRKGRSLLIALAIRTRSRMRVALELARIQGNAIASPSEALAPCTLSRVARAAELHASTVQRIGHTVWALSPRGLLPLSHLFSRPVRSRPDWSVDRLRNEIARRSENGDTDARIASDLRIPVRTIGWHRLRQRRTPGV
jgi:RNA polymerase sigma-54 factor